MNVNPISDLHLIHSTWTPPATEADFRVIAGDLELPRMDPTLMLPFLDVDTLFIPGNHDFYGFSLADGRAAWTEFSGEVNALAEARRMKGRLILIEDTGVYYRNGVRFLACTLWTDLDRGNPLAITRLLSKVTKGDFQNNKTFDVTTLSDFSEIVSFTPEQWLEDHRRHRAFLESELAKPFAGRTWVVTHHAPSWNTIEDRYRGDITNAAYAVNLDHLIGEVAVWQHGHLHNSFDQMLGETRMIRNPRGYESQGYRPNTDFQPGLIVSI